MLIHIFSQLLREVYAPSPIFEGGAKFSTLKSQQKYA